MPLGHVYELFDKRKPDVSVYVGSTTKHPLHRWAQHLIYAFEINRTGRCPVNDYMDGEGPEHFDFRVLEDCFWKEKVDLRKREQLYIDQRKPHCNRCAAYNPPTECECGKMVVCSEMELHRGSEKHMLKMDSLARLRKNAILAAAWRKKKQDGIRILQRHVVLSARPELSNAETPERITRVEAEAETKVDGSGEVPRAHPNTAAADSATG